ncbi:M23 family metallopeptidase [Paenibacillus cremeus]|uniref:M23 family metallopeptidase n=1 Tax=Paenibacillus cremeus TaxID=2163881 RepID=A0A559K8G7_9BACL|nr:M23 family metallopeptidase [Paenibacillus cremeus]TVY08421.1 M23 family metallopeptidase [Paenibacillus cremeus]
MKFKWFQNKLTFVIIPEANGSVVRVKLSRAVLWGAVFALLLLVGTSCFIYVQQMQSAASSYLRTTELHGKAAKLEQDLKHKNEAIEQLKNEIFTLSKQAAEVGSKMEEITRLRQDLLKLSPGSGSADQAVSAASPETPPASKAGGVGGPEIPVTAEQVRALASSTGARYTELAAEMNRLSASFVESKKQLLAQQERQKHIPSLWPTLSKHVTSPYGYRRDPFTSKLSFHKGMDIAGKLNDPVYAAAGGIVHSVGYDKLHGHNVVLEHSSGIRTWYMHLNQAEVDTGERVVKGQRIGKLGTTGRSTGPHLHYEVLRNGKSTDPAPYLPSHSRKDVK